MRRISALSYLLVFTVSLLIISCQKGPDDKTPETNCQLSKVYYYDVDGNIGDSLVYSYTDNKLTKAENADGHMILEYTNNKVTKRTLFVAGYPEVDGYDVFVYNPDGTLAGIKNFYESNGQQIQGTQYEFTYNSGKLEKYEMKVLDGSTGQHEPYQTAIYTYTGNNITKAVVNNLYYSTDVKTYTYKYDNKENYHRKNNSLVIDLNFIYEIDGSILPLVMSVNNITSLTEDGDEYMFSHKVDDKGNMIEWYLDSDLANKYIFDCN